MRKYFGVLAVLLLMGSAYAQAQDTQRIPLAIAVDLDGEATDDDQVLTAANGVLVDSGNYTLSANPDTCRVVNATINDVANITAGTITVTGTDCWGDALTCTWAFTGADDDGVVALTLGTGTATTCAFKTVTSVTNGALTGEGGADTVKVGYTAAPPATYLVYGIRSTLNGVRWIDPFRAAEGKEQVLVSGTAVTHASTAANLATFADLAVGDIIYLVAGGKQYERRITTYTDVDHIVIDSALPTADAPGATTPVHYLYKKLWRFVEPMDGWIPVNNKEGAYFVYDVDACTATGGCTSFIECSVFGAFSTDSFDPNIQIDTSNVATGATGTDTSSIDLTLAPFTHCRAGIQLITGDTAGTEDLNLVLMLRRRN